MKEFAETIADCDEALLQGYQQPDCYRVRARAYENLGETSKAEADNRKAAGLAKGVP
jgi:Tfp pilus assembly protein PilF